MLSIVAAVTLVSLTRLPAFVLAFIASVIAGFCMLAGGLALFRSHEATRVHRLTLLAFAGGSLLSLAFFEFLPEAFEADEMVTSVVLVITFSALFVLDILVHPHFERGPRTAHPVSVMGVVLGWWVHSFFDGIALYIAFTSSFTTGLLVSIGLLLHKFLDGINAGSLLLFHSDRARNSHILLWGLSAGTPAGAIASGLVRFPESPVLVAGRFALLAGLFIYIATADVLPHFHDHREPRTVAAFICGMALFAGLRLLLHH